MYLNSLGFCLFLLITYFSPSLRLFFAVTILPLTRMSIAIMRTSLVSPCAPMRSPTGFVQSPSPTLKRAKRTQMSKCCVSSSSSIFHLIGIRVKHLHSERGYKSTEAFFFPPRSICSAGEKKKDLLSF